MPGRPFILSGKFVNADPMPDSVLMGVFPKNNAYGVATMYYAKVRNGNFKIIIPKLSMPSKFLFGPSAFGKSRVIGQYYAQQGDSVHMEIDAKTSEYAISFLGKGSEKYNLINQLINQEKRLKVALDVIYRRYISPLKQQTNFDALILDSYFTEVQDTLLKWAKARSELIKNQRAIETVVADLLTSEYSNYDATWVNLIDVFHSRYHKDPALKEIIRSKFNSYVETSQITSDSSILLSPNYFIYRSFKLKTQLLVNSPSSTVEFIPYYNSIKESGQGLVGQRMITEFFIGNYTMEKITGYSPSVFDSLVLDASKVVTDPYYTALISDKGKTRKGSKLFQGEFLDKNGANFNMKALKGKVVLIDMWVTGCGSCASFHSNFKTNVYPQLKNIEDLVVLSIGMDKARQAWLAGVESGKYSSRSYVNVHAGALGTSHPFFTYYTNSLPLLLLVDRDGRIITKVNNTGPASELKALINKALLKTPAK
ncbi:MAG: hypothetical protein EOO90_03645 [Pedobacter sp.]|nr:MAG: hypothetical protein EOO90_03645 [Pedobacter sp.]